MNALHLHLLVNHISLFAVVFGGLALLWSWFAKSRTTLRFALMVFVLAGVGSWVAVESGEAAEDFKIFIEGDSKSFIHAHEEAAEWANALTLALAVCALAAEVALRFKPNAENGVRAVLLLLALVSLAAIARTAALGGEIRHTEIRSSQMPAGDSDNSD